MVLLIYGAYRVSNRRSAALQVTWQIKRSGSNISRRSGSIIVPRSCLAFVTAALFSPQCARPTAACSGQWLSPPLSSAIPSDDLRSVSNRWTHFTAAAADAESLRHTYQRNPSNLSHALPPLPPRRQLWRISFHPDHQLSVPHCKIRRAHV